MLKIGLVGAGGMGCVHYSNYAHIDDCVVVGIVDSTDAAKSRAEGWGVPIYDSIAELCKAQELDVIDICTPTFMHGKHIAESLSMKKHTICEKPICLHLEEAKQLYALAEQNGVQLYIAQVLQFTNEIAVLRQLVQSGEYGKVKDAFFERLSARPQWVQGGWLFDKSKSGLLPFDLHIHDLDVIVSLFGKPLDMSCTFSKTDQPHADQYRFIYKFAEGLNVCAEAAWFNADFPFTARWRVYFENAVVVYDGQSVTAYKFGEPPRVFDTEEKIKIPTGINLPPTGWFFNELTHLTGCIRRGEPSQLVPKEQILAVLETLEKIPTE